MALPIYTTQQVADFLTKGYYKGQASHIDVKPGGTVTYNASALDSTGQALAKAAFEAWTAVTGINFSAVENSATITFYDSQSGSKTGTDKSGGIIKSATIYMDSSDVSKTGAGLDTMLLQTYIHEIGHALGLGHGGNYNFFASYPYSALYQNDSWQMSIMSYFSQTDNTTTKASFAHVVTPQIADILAMQLLYGVAGNLRVSDTVYGNASTAGDYYDHLYDLKGPITWTIIDDGGSDTLNFDTVSAAQKLDLTPGAISDVEGLIGNLTIYSTTVIENAVGGSGADTIVGNFANNVLVGKAGADTIYGGYGDDILDGGDGNDILRGEAGNDSISGQDGADTIDGGIGDDTFDGGAGSDSLWGGGGDDYITGAAGNDVVDGGDGNDYLVGGADDDRIDGGSGADGLFGGDGNDSLLGGAGATGDRLEGGAGNDLIYGGGGEDVLLGGAGVDQFYFYLGIEGIDMVVDFARGVDQIVLDDFAGLTKLAQGANFTVDTSAVTTQATVIYDTRGYLYFDPDGVGSQAAVQFATLQGGGALTTADFLII